MDIRSKHLSSEDRGVIFAEHNRGSSQRSTSYCQIWFSECGLCQVGKLGVRPGSWFSPKSSHGRFMMAFGGRSSSDVFGEV
jgi:hypothetical protein